MARLIVHPGTPQAWEISLKEGANSIGRGDHNHFTIADSSVSGSHCEVFVQEGAIKIKDLGSTNGTFIDASPVTEAALKPGQKIHLGTVEVLLETDTPEPPGLKIAATVKSSPAAPSQPQPAEPAPRIRVTLTTPRLQVATPPAPTLQPQQARETVAVAGGPSVSPRLQISKPPPPSLESIPEPPPVEPPRIAPPPSGKSTVCKYHPKSPARWFCAKCHKTFCDLCVNLRRIGEQSLRICRSCSGECTPLEIKIEIPEDKSFFQLLPGAFVYPFKREGLILLLCTTVFFVVVGFLKSFSFWLSIIFWGYMFSYMQNLIHSTASGDESPPSLPDITNFFSDILGAFLQLAGLAIFCFGPAIGLLIWAFFGGPSLPWIIFASFALGTLYFPMAFLAVAMYDTVAAVNPMLVVPAILKLPLQYLVVCVLWGGILLFRGFSDVMFEFIPIPFLPAILSGFLTMYFVTMEMRMLGLFYLANKDRLGWFSR